MALLVYAVPLLAAVFIGLALWKHKDPPGVAYVAFISAAGALFVVIAVDTEWYKGLPGVSIAGQNYGILPNEKASLGAAIARLESGQRALASNAGVPTPDVPLSDLGAFGRVLKCVPAGMCTGPSAKGLGFTIDLTSDQAMENSCRKACRDYARDNPLEVCETL